METLRSAPASLDAIQGAKIVEGLILPVARRIPALCRLVEVARLRGARSATPLRRRGPYGILSSRRILASLVLLLDECLRRRFWRRETGFSNNDEPEYLVTIYWRIYLEAWTPLADAYTGGRAGAAPAEGGLN